MLDRGATAAKVATEMGIGRNAALGRIWRDPELKLQGKQVKTRRRNQLLAKFPAKPKIQRHIAATVSPPGDMISRPVVRPPVQVLAPVVEVTRKACRPHPMALIGTGTHWCKWPVSPSRDTVGGFICCGAATEPFKPYCQDHLAKSRQAQ
jgi:hypothetical protein